MDARSAMFGLGLLGLLGFMQSRWRWRWRWRWVRVTNEAVKETEIKPKAGRRSDDEALLMEREMMLVRREEFRVFRDGNRNPRGKVLPVTLVTGFLGAGKTTLLKHILKVANGLRIGVVVNDYADLNVDYETVREEQDYDVMELTNGCMCCSLKGNLQKVFVDIGKHVDYLLVETSGVTDPMEMVRILESNIVDQHRLRLDAVVSVIDSDSWDATGSNPSLEYADIVIVNKIDLVQGEENQEKLCESIRKRACNGVRIVPSSYCKVPLEWILDVIVAEPDREAFGRMQRGKAREQLTRYQVPIVGGKLVRRSVSVSESNKSHENENKWTSFSFNEEQRPFEIGSFQMLLGSKLWQDHVIRFKGTVWFRHEKSRRFNLEISGRQRFSLQDCGTWVSSPKIAIACVLSGASEAVREELKEKVRECCVPTVPFHEPESRLSESMKRLEPVLRTDFALLSADDETVVLRLTGHGRFPHSEPELETKFGLDLNKCNALFIHYINHQPSSSVLLFPSSVHAKQQDGFLLASIAKLEKVQPNLWKLLEQGARFIYRTEFRDRIPACRCD